MSDIDPHFFRHEFGRLVSVLGRVFGVRNLATCEDIAQETLCRALEVWKLEGVPNEPSAWLTTAAKNRAIDALRRERTRSLALPELARYVESEWTLVPMVSQLFDGDPNRSDELAMMFTLAQPRLPEASRIALILRVLCGFGIAARLPGRLDEHGALLPFVDQDRSRWDRGLVRVGLELLDRGAAGDDVSTYHLEAAIAAHHALAPSASETPWEAIARLYDALFARAPSPIVALNRAIALGEAFGGQRAGERG